MSKSIVSIKGTSDGLIFYFNTEEAGFGQLCATLEERLQTSGDFFINADYIIDEESKFSADELKALDGIMAKYNLIKGKRTARVLPSDDRQDVIYQTVGGNSMLVTKSVRSGQRLSVRGNVVVMGDINPGGEILATGNIVVMGTCRGVLHAGAEGDTDAYIICYNMRAQQLRISSCVATVPQGASLTPLKMATIKNGAIVLTDYVPSQFKEAAYQEA